jgi:hypothetical protein
VIRNDFILVGMDFRHTSFSPHPPQP